jgi:putative Mg2+ transporter-C (MgtC) family protein
MMEVSAPGDLLDLLSRLAIATALGAAVGLDREIHEKPAGFRTHAMVSLGAALMTIVGLGFRQDDGPIDAGSVSRVLQGIIAGIGFIGGGAILRREDAQVVEGLTTASTIWVVAGVGIAAGLGMWPTALATVGFTIFLLVIGGPVERALRYFRPPSKQSRS